MSKCHGMLWVCTCDLGRHVDVISQHDRMVDEGYYGCNRHDLCQITVAKQPGGMYYSAVKFTGQ